MDRRPVFTSIFQSKACGLPWGVRGCLMKAQEGGSSWWHVFKPPPFLISKRPLHPPLPPLTENRALCPFCWWTSQRWYQNQNRTEAEPLTAPPQTSTSPESHWAGKGTRQMSKTERETSTERLDNGRQIELCGQDHHRDMGRFTHIQPQHVLW